LSIGAGPHYHPASVPAADDNDNDSPPAVISAEPGAITDAGADDETPPAQNIICESPGAVDINVYETAYQEEVQRILDAKAGRATIYLARRVERSHGAKALATAGEGAIGAVEGAASSALAGLRRKAADGGFKAGFARLAEEAMAAKTAVGGNGSAGKAD